ncbi:adenosine deaminase [Ensifer sp. NM-2]|uniref:adenosine deaminase n=1 Tax=Ensifer sp. NM-2 TaxID=2109730 RepID=UPI000D13B5EC|nr:adenosine deaminase [Ensifer sp. NM-2]PSS64504.1 adenosine deaminase [Ensifer sp. NM-2]
MNAVPWFDIKAVPKAELHVHVEGTLEPGMLLDFARRNDVAIPYKSMADVLAAYRFCDLQSFLEIYWAGLTVLRTERDFYELTLAYLSRVRQDNVVHAEIYITPSDHTERGVPFEAVMNGISAAYADARSRLDITGGMIPCVRRHKDVDEAFAAIEMARPWQGRILALGLGGPEKGYPPSPFVDVFAQARALGWKTTAHAGEEGPSDYVAEAIDRLHVDRIDHGVQCEADPELMRRIAEKDIPLTVCPLSNVALKVFPSLEEHNLRRLLRAGICVTINSDDPAYFGGHVNENFIRSTEALSLTEDEQLTLADNSLRAAFMDEDRRRSNRNVIGEMRPVGLTAGSPQ